MARTADHASTFGLSSILLIELLKMALNQHNAVHGRNVLGHRSNFQNGKSVRLGPNEI